MSLTNSTIEKTPEVLKQSLKEMVFIRAFEEKCNVVYREGKAGGYLHVYIGMEALAVGWLNCLKKGHDYVITAYRDHAHALVLGSDPVAVMAEIMGREGGLSRGRGGSMHLYDPPKGLFGGWGIVGGNIPLGAGLALGSKYKGEDRVTLNFLGDGASNAGVFFETLNMAALWDLPCIFLIENNFFAMGTRLEYHAPDTELHKRGIPFGIKHERVDGQDLIQVYKDAERIIETVRKEQKPYLVEIMTYRFSGHGAADNDQALYRTKDEVIEAKKRDPIHLLKDKLVEQKILTEQEFKMIEEESVNQVEEITRLAENSPHPSIQNIYENVYSDIEPERGH